MTATANAAVAETTKGGLCAKEPIKIAPSVPTMAIEAVALVVLVQLAGSHTVPFHVRVPYHVHILYHVLCVLPYHNAMIVGNMLED